MRSVITIAVIGSMGFAIACGSAKSAGTNSAKTSDSKVSSSAGSPSEAVKKIYDQAIKRDCAAIPPMLTDDFRKAAGTSKDAMDALCDSFTDSGKLASVELAGEDLNGDSATVKVTQIFKDGKKEQKEERMKRSGGSWLMDS